MQLHRWIPRSEQRSWGFCRITQPVNSVVFWLLLCFLYKEGYQSYERIQTPRQWASCFSHFSCLSTPENCRKILVSTSTHRIKKQHFDQIHQVVSIPVHSANLDRRVFPQLLYHLGFFLHYTASCSAPTTHISRTSWQFQSLCSQLGNLDSRSSSSFFWDWQSHIRTRVRQHRLALWT